jgi:hypothetical protein
MKLSPKTLLASLAIGVGTFLGGSLAAKAAYYFTFTPQISYSFCNNFSQGGQQCPGQFTETVISNSGPFTFAWNEGTSTVTSVAEILVRTNENTNDPFYFFDSGSFTAFGPATTDPTQGIFTFTGPDITFGTGSNAITVPVIFQIRITDVDPLSTNPSFPSGISWELISFGTVCTIWQDNGNSNCLAQDLRRIPNPLSALALLPLTAVGKLRNRYRKPSLP